jgi:hypothetical protein
VGAIAAERAHSDGASAGEPVVEVVADGGQVGRGDAGVDVAFDLVVAGEWFFGAVGGFDGVGDRGECWGVVGFGEGEQGADD